MQTSMITKTAVRPAAASLAVSRRPAPRAGIVARAYKMKLIDLDSQNVMEGVIEEGQYILDVAEQLGADIPWVCKSGTCCSCAVRLREGTVDYSDLFITTPRLDSLLSEEEIADGLVPSCRSRATSDVVIEYSPMGLH